MVNVGKAESEIARRSISHAQ